jgi:uncharacterized MAPEG superfamily protein
MIGFVTYPIGAGNMSAEIHWLSLTLAATALFWAPYVLNRMAVRGLLGTVSNPSVNDAPLAEWAQRAQKAHENAVENLVVFAPAVLAIQVLGRGDSLSATACALYFYSRIAHYIVYTAGIPWLRTLAFFGSWIGTAMLVARLLGVL